jgi:hypothetical protein
MATESLLILKLEPAFHESESYPFCEVVEVVKGQFRPCLERKSAKDIYCCEWLFAQLCRPHRKKTSLFKGLANVAGA